MAIIRSRQQMKLKRASARLLPVIIVTLNVLELI